MITPRVDAHHHVWDPAARTYPWMSGAVMDPVRRRYDARDLGPALAEAEIDASVLVQTVSDVAETEEFLQLARETPWIGGVVGWVDLTSAAVGDELDRLAERGPLVGIRHQAHDEADAAWLSRADVRRGVEAVADRGLAYDLLVRTRELPAAIELVRGLPEVRFVLDHIAKPPIASGSAAELTRWRALTADLAASPNVSVKLSGMITEADWDAWDAGTLAPYIRHVLDVFGPERAMFGSDWPVCLLAAGSYGEVVDALGANLGGLSEAEQAAVWGVTAARTYALTVD